MCFSQTTSSEGAWVGDASTLKDLLPPGTDLRGGHESHYSKPLISKLEGVDPKPVASYTKASATIFGTLFSASITQVLIAFF